MDGAAREKPTFESCSQVQCRWSKDGKAQASERVLEGDVLISFPKSIGARDSNEVKVLVILRL